MTVYKNSEDFARIKHFSAIVFDCDGVLIDSSRSYDLALTNCFRAFTSLLKLDFRDEEFMNAVNEIRKLGSFNNDWDTLYVAVAYAYSMAKDTKTLDGIAQVMPLSERIKSFESQVSRARMDGGDELEFQYLLSMISKLPEGTNREQLSQAILKSDKLTDKVNDVTSYPEPVGQGFLSTLYDEVVYGKRIFREMYGLDCATQSMSNPGLILQEKKIVNETALVSFFSASQGNLGIITGRPRVPTLFTLGDTFAKWFRRPELCMFTGDYLLDVDEVKPSPKPMFKVAKNLDSKSPILYVGDSGEDVLLAKNVNASRRLDSRVYFAGIASTDEKARYFESEGSCVDCIVSDVNELGSVVERNASQ